MLLSKYLARAAGGVGGGLRLGRAACCAAGPSHSTVSGLILEPV
jgi:hypothetical protein